MPPTNPDAEASPGPWGWSIDYNGHEARIYSPDDANDGVDIAVCRGPDRVANAKRIAAVPKLVAALKMIAQAGKREPGITFIYAADVARAALREAGEMP